MNDVTIDVAARYMILVIIGLSVLVFFGGYMFYRSENVMPFAVGVIMGSGVNIIKVIWLKKAVTSTLDRSAPNSAKRYYQAHYFLRLILTAGVLFVAGLLHGTVDDPGPVNLFGAVFGILTYPIAAYSMRFLFRNQTVDLPADTSGGISSAEDAIDEINEILAKGEQEEK